MARSSTDTSRASSVNGPYDHQRHVSGPMSGTDTLSAVDDDRAESMASRNDHSSSDMPETPDKHAPRLSLHSTHSHTQEITPTVEGSLNNSDATHQVIVASSEIFANSEPTKVNDPASPQSNAKHETETESFHESAEQVSNPAPTASASSTTIGVPRSPASKHTSDKTHVSKKRRLRDEREVIVLDDDETHEELERRNAEMELYNAVKETKPVGFLGKHGPIMSLAVQSPPVLIRLQSKHFWIARSLLAEGSNVFKTILTQMEHQRYPNHIIAMDDLGKRFASAHFEFFVEFLYNMSLWRPSLHQHKITLVFQYVAAKELEASRWAFLLCELFKTAVEKTAPGHDLQPMADLVHVMYGPLSMHAYGGNDPVRQQILALILKQMPVLKRNGIYDWAIGVYPALRDEIINGLFPGEPERASMRQHGNVAAERQPSTTKLRLLQPSVSHVKSEL